MHALKRFAAIAIPFALTASINIIRREHKTERKRKRNEKKRARTIGLKINKNARPGKRRRPLFAEIKVFLFARRKK